MRYIYLGFNFNEKWWFLVQPSLSLMQKINHSLWYLCIWLLKALRLGTNFWQYWQLYPDDTCLLSMCSYKWVLLTAEWLQSAHIQDRSDFNILDWINWSTSSSAAKIEHLVSCIEIIWSVDDFSKHEIWGHFLMDRIFDNTDSSSLRTHAWTPRAHKDATWLQSGGRSQCRTRSPPLWSFLIESKPQNLLQYFI